MLGGEDAHVEVVADGRMGQGVRWACVAGGFRSRPPLRRAKRLIGVLFVLNFKDSR